jgi:hypothetical protein
MNISIPGRGAAGGLQLKEAQLKVNVSTPVLEILQPNLRAGVLHIGVENSGNAPSNFTINVDCSTGRFVGFVFFVNVFNLWSFFFQV